MKVYPTLNQRLLSVAEYKMRSNLPSMKSNNISLLLFKTKYFFLNTRDILLKNGGNLNITSKVLIKLINVLVIKRRLYFLELGHIF